MAGRRKKDAEEMPRSIKTEESKCRMCPWAKHAGGNIWTCPFVTGTCAWQGPEKRKKEMTEDG